MPTQLISRNALGSALLFATLLGAPALAAGNVYLSLKANGEDIEGDSSVQSLGRENTIECYSFRTAGLRMTNPPLPAEQRKVTITCRKAIDKATPLLIDAMGKFMRIEMTARFFRPNRTGDGTTEQHYTIVGETGRITSIKQLSPDTLSSSNLQSPELEELTIEFASTTFKFDTRETTFP